MERTLHLSLFQCVLSSNHDIPLSDSCVWPWIRPSLPVFKSSCSPLNDTNHCGFNPSQRVAFQLFLLPVTSPSCARAHPAGHQYSAVPSIHPSISKGLLLLVCYDLLSCWGLWLREKMAGRRIFAFFPVPVKVLCFMIFFLLFVRAYSPKMVFLLCSGRLPV